MEQQGTAVEQAVQRALDEHAGMPGALLPVLHALQSALGCVPAVAVPLIAEGLNLSRADVHGVISFYDDFRQQPVGRHQLRICRAEACQAVGAAALEDHARRVLGLDMGETRADGSVTLDAVYCLGNCACGPSLAVGERVHARVTPARLDALLAGLGIAGGSGGEAGA